LLRTGIISGFCAHGIESSGINKFKESLEELSPCDHFRKDFGREAIFLKEHENKLDNV
jgi:hypothetical protein